MGTRNMYCPDFPKGFRAIDGFPFYCIDAEGTVLSCRTRGGRFVPWHPMISRLNPSKANNARLFVGLRNGKKYAFKAIHRLVLETFRGPCPEGLEGCHNDGDPFNNSLSNLRWDTQKSNMTDRDKHGRTARGIRSGMAKLDEAKVIKIRKLYNEGASQSSIGSLYGLHQSTISDVILKQTWKHVIP